MNNDTSAKTYYVTKYKRLEDKINYEQNKLAENAMYTGLLTIACMSFMLSGNKFFNSGEELRANLLYHFGIVSASISPFTTMKLFRNIKNKAHLKIEEEELMHNMEEYGIYIDDIDMEGRVR